MAEAGFLLSGAYSALLEVTTYYNMNTAMITPSEKIDIPSSDDLYSLESTFRFFRIKTLSC